MSGSRHGGDKILGWRLDLVDRATLLARFPPRYAEAVADHVTHGRASEAPERPDAAHALVIGRADDGEGVEALVVAIAGATDRWDAGTYHVTWSLGAGRQAKESNDVIARCGWQPIENSLSVRLARAEWT